MSVGVRFRPGLLVVLLVPVVLGGLWTRSRVQPLQVYDQPFYLGIAFDLLHHGRYTDGYCFAGGDAATLRPPGMRFTPLYPGLLAAAAEIDPSLRRGMDCLVTHGGRDASCTRNAPSMRWLQFLLLAATMGMLGWCGWRCSGRPRTGLLALGLALLAGPLLLSSVDYLMTEIVSLFLLVASQALALRAVPANEAAWRPDRHGCSRPAWFWGWRCCPARPSRCWRRRCWRRGPSASRRRPGATGCGRSPASRPGSAASCCPGSCATPSCSAARR